MKDALIGAAAVLLLAALLPDLVAPKIELVYDDSGILETNDIVRARDYGAIWTKPYWEGVKKLNQQDNLHRPIFLTFAAFFQNNLGILRILVFLSHIALGWFLWLTLRKYGGSRGDPWIALLGVAFFLLHPAQVEVTAQLIGLMETMPTLLGLAALFVMPTRPWLAVALVGIAPGWKEIGYAWIVGIGMVFTWRRQYTFAVAAAGICLSWLGLRYISYGALFKSTVPPYVILNPLVTMDAWEGLFSRIALIGHQIRLFLWPFPLSSDYGHNTLPLPGYPIQLWVMLPLAFIGLLYRYRRSIPIEAAAMLATLIPTLHLTGPTGSIFGERFGYSFRMGLAMLGAMLLQKALGSRNEKEKAPAEGYSQSYKIAMASLCAILALFYWKTIDRHKDWQSPETLFAKDLASYPGNAKMRFNYGVAMGRLKRWPEAHEQFQHTLALAPDFPEAHFRMGMVYREMGKEAEAQKHWRVADELGFPMDRMK